MWPGDPCGRVAHVAGQRQGWCLKVCFPHVLPVRSGERSLFQDTLTGECRCPGFVGTQREVGVRGCVSLWGRQPLRSDCPGVTALKRGQPIPHLSTIAGHHWVPGWSLAALPFPGCVGGPGDKQVPALVGLPFLLRGPCEPDHEVGVVPPPGHR